MRGSAASSRPAGLSVGLFTYSTRPRGSVVVAAELASALARRGVDVVLYAIDKGEGTFYRQLECPVELIPGAAASSEVEALLEQRMAEVSSFILRHRPRHQLYHAMDCLVANGIRDAASSGFEVPWVETVHHLDEDESVYVRSCRMRSILAAHRVATVSLTTARALQRETGVLPAIIHNGADVGRFRDSAPARGVWSFGFAPYVLSVGGIEPRKNSLEALRGFERLRRVIPALHWVIAGGATLWDQTEYQLEFQRELVRSGAEGHVHLLGVVGNEQLTELYHNAKVFLHVARCEGWGLAVIEAGLSRVPLVVPRGAPYDEYLGPDEANFCETEDPDSICNAALLALSRDELARERVSSRLARFDWDRTATEYLTFYGDLLRERAPTQGELRAGGEASPLSSV